MLSPTWLLIKRYLQFKRTESFVSVIAAFSFVGIMLGTATLIVVMAVMGGFRQQLLSRILGANGHVGVYYTHTPHTPQTTQWKKLHQTLQAVPQVKSAFPVIEQQALCMAWGRAHGALVRGITQHTFDKRPFLKDSLSAGSTENFTGNTIMIGKTLAQQMGVTLGDTVTLAAPQLTHSPLGPFPRFQPFRIVGILHFGMLSYDRMMLFMPLDTAQHFFSFDQTISGFELFLHHPDVLSEAQSTLQQIANKADANVLDWQQANAQFFSVVQVERNVMFIILSLMITVAAFNIIACMVMLVKDKTRDIGILRAMGASRRMIGGLFLWIGFTIGSLGTLTGAGLGAAIAANIDALRRIVEKLSGRHLFPKTFYLLDTLPASVNGTDILLVVSLGFTLSLLSALYPALRAARSSPRKALCFT